MTRATFFFLFFFLLIFVTLLVILLNMRNRVVHGLFCVSWSLWDRTTGGSFPSWSNEPSVGWQCFFWVVLPSGVFGWLVGGLQMKELVDTCLKMLDHWDIKVQGFGAWCIFYLTQDNPEFMARTLEAGLSCSRLCKLLRCLPCVHAWLGW